MAEKDELGQAGEDAAARFLQQHGYRIYDRRWRCPEGEIDLVVQRDQTVVCVEVKTRRSLGFGHPFEAITDAKRMRLQNLARSWFCDHPAMVRGQKMRIDAIAVIGSDENTFECEHLRDIA